MAADSQTLVLVLVGPQYLHSVKVLGGIEKQVFMLVFFPAGGPWWSGCLRGNRGFMD